LTNNGGAETTVTSATAINALTPDIVADLDRYLDATRAALLFSRSVILVEGPAEQFLVPYLAKQVMGVDLDAQGVAVIPIHGVHFAAYAALFGEEGIPKRCAIAADGDLIPSDALSSTTDDDLDDLDLMPPNLDELENEYVRVFKCATTFERAVTMVGTIPMLISAFEELGAKKGSLKLRSALKAMLNTNDASEKSQLIKPVRDLVLRTAKRIGKARFAQVASKHVDKATSIPSYLVAAINWATRNETN
jgi:putative ATP-dependent endonuclease of OLD family